jgi:Domain of unknown function (DUF4440)
MKRWGVGLLAVGVAVGVLASVAVAPAAAQSRGSVGFRSRSGHNFFRPSPPRASDLSNPPLFSPFSSGTLERNFAIMRATSPNPNLYMGGQLNPLRSTFHGGFYGDGFYGGGFYGGGYYGGGFYGYPYDYGYAGYAPFPSGALYPSVYSLYGRAFPPYVAPERIVIIQREIIVPREEKPGDTDYYLSPRESHAGESLSDAVEDIRKAWLNGDFERLKARIRDSGKVRIYLRGKYKYSISAGDFAQMTRDAMSRIDTSSFELSAPERLDGDRAFVSGKHVYKDPDGEKREVFVSYVLERDGGRWKIVEAGSSSSAIAKHED